MALIGMHKQISTHTEAVMTPLVVTLCTERSTRPFSCDQPVRNLMWHRIPGVLIQLLKHSILLTGILLQVYIYARYVDD